METATGKMRNATKIAGLVALAMALGMAASAGRNDKALLPEYVLKARSVTVLILPDTAEPLTDPTANRKAQEEVEKALMKWGRFRLTQEAFTADLVIGIRKGAGRIVNPTISGGPIDSRPVTIESTGGGQGRVGAQRGQPPGESLPGNGKGRPTVGMESGTVAEDVFEVFQGGDAYGAGSAPLWTCVAKDGLKPPVAAVEKFRKALEEAEKAAQKRQSQQNKKP